MPVGGGSGARWNVVTKYSPGVLIGNWQEERMLNEKKYFRPMATHKVDSVQELSGNSDHHSTAVPTSGIFGHMQCKNEDLITWYDEDYNRRPREGGNKLPALRRWNSNTMSWVPERSDYPLQGAPTNYGLHDTLKQNWCMEKKQPRHGISEQFDTTYRWSYNHWSSDHYLAAHCSQPRPPDLIYHCCAPSQ